MEILYQANTDHHQIRITQEGSVRKLMSGHGMCQEQSGIDVSDLRIHFFDYSLLGMYSLLFVPSPSNVLVVGLGGAVIPREFLYYYSDIKIDIIEIDPDMVKIAKDFFFFKETNNVNIYLGDAFNVVKELSSKYDIVILDAFLGNYIPFHLMSIEFLQSVSEVLKEDAVLAVNSCSVHPAFNNQLNTFRKIYGEKIYCINGIRNSLVTMIYIPSGNCIISDSLSLSDKYFPSLKPKLLKFTDAIKGASIFSIKNHENLYNN